MIELHYLENSRAHRILWLMEELDLQYQVVRYERDPKTLAAPPALRHIHPLGKSPVIVDDGAVFAESGAIIEYLVEAHGQGRLIPPCGTAQYWRYIYWLHYAEGSAMPPLLIKLVFDRLPAAVPWPLRPLAAAIAGGARRSFIDPQLALHMGYWESELAKAPWFAGEEFSAADIQMSYPLEAAAARGGLNGARYPGAMSWLERIRQRPAYRRAVAAGGPALPPGS